MSQKLFSVIIPLYNKEQYIKNTVNYVLSQTISDFELIIIDDGSTDYGPQIISSIKDSRIKLIRQSNAGVSAARNRGIREAIGKYICFLDADDVWSRDFLQTAKSLFDKFPDAGMVCPSYQVTYGNRIVHPKWRSVMLDRDSYVNDFYEMATAPFWVCNSSCVAIKKEILLKMEYWFPESETFYEDFDFWIRLGTVCKVAHSNKICATYQRATSNNARERHTNIIVYSVGYMNTLNRLLDEKKLTIKQREWIREIKDRRMVPFIFSLILAQEHQLAKSELNKWSPCLAYKKYKLGLKIGNIMPHQIMELVQLIRRRIF